MKKYFASIVLSWAMLQNRSRVERKSLCRAGRRWLVINGLLVKSMTLF